MKLPRPRKRFGQHFLHDANITRRIVDALAPQTGETIVEIGAGRGALTEHLINRNARLRAIEFDRDLAAYLHTRFANAENFTLIEADALNVDFCRIIEPAASARVIGNLPYNISTPILTSLIEHRRCLSEFVLMLQREVVERITARAGETERGFLSVFVEAYCTAQTLFDVPPAAFAPPPKVWSTVVKLRTRTPDALIEVDEKLLWRIVSAGFAQRRKTIFNNLRTARGALNEQFEINGGVKFLLEQSLIDSQRRAETLTLEEWARVVQQVARRKDEVQ